MVTGIIQAIRQRGFRLVVGNGVAGRTTSGRFDRAEGAGATTVATGTVAAIRDRGFGYIARDQEGDRTDLFFHRSAVTGDGFDRLLVGQRVSFDEEADPRDRNRRRAVNVRPGGEEEPT